jgi:TPR repeat protein
MHHYKSDELTACWMRIAANAGDARSQAMMAWFAHQGEGTQKNLPEAEEWAQKSAHQQDAFGEIMLGLMYENNEVRFQNPIISQSVIDEAYVQINLIRHQQGQPPIQHQQAAQGPDPRAVGAAALGILLMGALSGMSRSSPFGGGSSVDMAAHERGEQIHRDYEEGCANGDVGSCHAAGETMPEPQ